MTAEIAHPRDVFGLAGQEPAEAAFADALARGRLHHAWLLTGPEGTGKATFAYRAARRLLGAAADPSRGTLGVSPDDRVSRLISARSHPDILTLERVGEDGKPRKVIPVDEARKISGFFAKAPAMAAFRVAIIDAADDLNVNAANAVLKTLEEPPARGVLFLVSHAPGGLLATIRSRCRRLAFAPLADETVARMLRERMEEISVEESLRVAGLAKGSPGKALALASGRGLELDQAAHELLTRLPQTDDAALLALADKFRGGEGAAAFSLVFERLAAQVHTMAVAQAAAGEGGLSPWAEAYEMLQRLPREAEALNLDRADAFFTAVRELKAAARC